MVSSRKKFLFFPKHINNNWYWLRTVTVYEKRTPIIVDGRVGTRVEKSYKI